MNRNEVALEDLLDTIKAWHIMQRILAFHTPLLLVSFSVKIIVEEQRCSNICRENPVILSIWNYAIQYFF